jgi:hypothetical protein
LLTGSGAFEKEVEAELDNGLKFNGKLPGDNAENYRRLDLSPPMTAAQAATTLDSFAPHVVVSVTGPAINQVVYQLEREWGSEDATRPYYILSPLNFGTMSSLLSDFATVTTIPLAIERRLFGINVAATEDRALYNEYLTRLRRLESTASGQVENVYDTVYFLAYATLASGTLNDASGPKMLDGMHKLIAPPGAPLFNVGSENLQQALVLLSQQTVNPIRLMGLLGPPNFNLQGIRKTTGSVYCTLKLQDGAGFKLELRDHVGHYDDTATPPGLRLASTYKGSLVPHCLTSLNLPEQL